MFNSHFIDSVQDLAQGFGLREKVITPSNDNLPLFGISEVPESSITKILGKFKNSKAKDAFTCDCAFLKKYKSIICTPIAHLVNLSIKQSFFPNAWKSAVITPIFKAGDATNITNYRPISIRGFWGCFPRF